MIQVSSRQRGVYFVLCKSPVTIDKSAEWGPGNLQHGAAGAFLKIDQSGADAPATVSHLVQPTQDYSAPVGWLPATSGTPNHFDKGPVWIAADELLKPGLQVTMRTRDGEIVYEIKKPSYRCYNDHDGGPDPSDGWIQTREELVRDYHFAPGED